ncbi:MAG: nucleoside-diphosphate sugar epimerase/dehydratase, partial [Clostridium sp.]
MLAKRKNKIAFLIIIDLILIAISYLLAFYFRFTGELEVPLYYMEIHSSKIILSGIIYIISFSIFKLYKSLWSFAGIDEVMSGTTAVFLGLTTNMLISLLLKDRIPLMVTILAGIMIFILCNGIRIEYRLLRRFLVQLEERDKVDFKNVLVVGAGMAGSLVQREYKRNTRFKKRVVG